MGAAMPTIQIRTTTDTRRQSVALMAALAQDEGEASIGDLIDVALRGLIDSVGLDCPQPSAESPKLGRPMTSAPIALLCRPKLRVWVSDHVAGLLSTLRAHLDLSVDQVWSIAVEVLHAEVCEAEAATPSTACPVGLQVASQFAAAA